MSVFRELFEIIFDAREISTVVEIGVESGQVSRVYAELGASAVYCVDPHPSDEMRANLAGHEATKLVQGASPAVLPELPLADLYVIDGDHNYATVHEELTWLMANAPDAVIVLHDVLWPCARRDSYYQPSTVDLDSRHPDGADGPTVWHDELTLAGFVGLDVFTWATEAGGERNGVLTAVEDALGSAKGWRFELVPAVFGMGILARTSPATDALFERLRPFTGSRLLALMENNRIALYCRVLQMQCEAVAHADDASRLAETITRQRQELECAALRHAGEIHTLNREIERLRGLLSQRLRPRLSSALYRVGRAASHALPTR
ncbi:class I SAM-dependent methyltransferase [Actinophytocola sp.]|uniref:class I SAM-dependent methyltransferase n=1 Tax=Actinophytocola sp. TaxID=1872138 RepID=UPI002D7EA5EE|nr:class I SAM-dependent methyltransferase [Actinophytocola sp.]HET9138840.1 class I SAM-dependent methyltransferase [Actinophytocola sp.]